MALTDKINDGFIAVANLLKGKVNKTDVITVAQGGTGATNTATARSNLGLGTASTKDAGISANQLLQLDATGKALSTNLPNTIKDSAIEISSNNILYLNKSNPNKSKSFFGLADYASGGSGPTGAIVFKSNNKSNLTATLRSIKILGFHFTTPTPQLIDISLVSYTGLTTGASSVYYARVDSGTLSPLVRTAYDANGDYCIIIGDTNTAWSSLNISLLFGVFGKASNTYNLQNADLLGWTSYVSTDLSAMTKIVTINAETSLIKTDWSNIQNKSTPDFSSVTSGQASYKKGWRKLTATLPSQAGEITIAHGVTTVETVQAKVTNTDGIIIYNNDIDPTNQFYIRVSGASLVLGVTANSIKVFGQSVTIYLGEEL